MDKHNKQEAPSPSPSPSLLTNNKDHHHDSSPRKPPLPASAAAGAGGGTGGGGGGGDRLKRDEWSEGAVSSLLEAYEAKWVLRNRAKLKGHDWEDVARHVTSRAGSSKSPKTQTQCKNKIESMKKRYRSESATADVSSWPLYSRLDLLLRGSAAATAPPPPAAALGDPPCSAVPVASTLPMFEHAPPEPQPPPLPAAVIRSSSVPVDIPAPVIRSSSVPVDIPAPVPDLGPIGQGVGQNSIDSNGVDRENIKEDMVGTKIPDHQLSEKMEIETDCSTPALYSNDKEKIQSKNHKTRITDNRKRRRKSENWDVAESIRWLAKVMVRSEQAKAETMRELEKMRADAEVKRGEIDLKRTEIIAHTQLEIARLLAASLGKGVDPSLRIGRS